MLLHLKKRKKSAESGLLKSILFFSAVKMLSEKICTMKLCPITKKPMRSGRNTQEMNLKIHFTLCLHVLSSGLETQSTPCWSAGLVIIITRQLRLTKQQSVLLRMRKKLPKKMEKNLKQLIFYHMPISV